jgi:hypothetical protein
LNNKNQGILLNFLSRIKPAYQRAYARRPGKDTNPKAVNLSGSVDVLIEIIGASGQPEYGTTNAVTVKVNSVGWAEVRSPSYRLSSAGMWDRLHVC